MKCVNCEFSKETIPAQEHYIYCTKREEELSAEKAFKTCHYREDDVMIRLGYKYLGDGTWIKGFKLGVSEK